MLIPMVLCAVLHTVAELEDLSDKSCGNGLPFRIEGRVEAVLASDSYVLADQTGRTLFRQEGGERPTAGSQASVSGHTGLFTGSQQRQYFVTNVTVTVGGASVEPISAAVGRILAGDCNYRLVRVSGTVVDVFSDDVDKDWDYFVLHADGERLTAAVPNRPDSRLQPERILNADVTVTGVVLPDHCGPRVFVGPHLELTGVDAIRIVAPSTSFFDVPTLEIDSFRHRRPTDIVAAGRHKVLGRILAVWGDGHALVSTPDQSRLRVRFVSGERSPAVGQPVEIAGQPETDIFHLNLSRARWRPARDPSADAEPDIAQPLTDRTFRHREARRYCIDMSIHGKLTTFTGKVLADPAPAADGGMRLSVDCGDFRVDYDVGALGPRLPDLQPGTRLRATGIAIVELDNWQLGAVFPTVKGVTVVSRSPADAVILSRAPWWTPFRLTVVILALFGGLVVLVITSIVLGRLVDHRGKQLAAATIAGVESDLKTQERTRLATELHDSISQTLTGVSMEIEAARLGGRGARPGLDRHLDVAAQALQSCRTELRNCLWDLRSQAIDEPDTETAVRRTLQPHLKGVRLDVRLAGVTREMFTESTLHALLQIIRELTVNALRHGQATRVAVEGTAAAGRLALAVTDNGHGFDTAHVPGVDDGHYGLQGVRERIKLLAGTFAISSVPGSGTKAEITLPLPDEII